MSTDHQLELSNGTILLRPFSLIDAASLHEAVRESMAELGRWLSWCHPDYGIADSHEFLQARGEAHCKDGEFGFAIVDKANGRFLGACGINQFDAGSQRANLGYWVRTSGTHRGVAQQAARLVARWALEALGLQRIEIVAAVDNVASQRVAEKVGATRECVARHRLRVHGVPHDAVVFSLTRDDLPRL